jgi:formylmethanofuran dehydrogenase subunit D
MIPENLKNLRKLLGLSLKATLDSGSSTVQGKIMRGGRKIVEGDEYRKYAAVCYMNPQDMNYLGASEGDNVKVSSSVSSVCLRASASSCPRGVVFVPKGPWINSIVEAETSQSGSPHFKGMEVSVSATDEKVKTVEEMMDSYGRR